jgi:GT2 family glycosyltransferase
MNLKEQHNNENYDLSIIIVNYNLAKEIDNCLSSFLKVAESAIKFSFEIIVVDNNSFEKDIFEVEKKYQNDNIKFFYLESNLGFGKGCNFGFSKANGIVTCFLNPDTIIKEDIFTPIIDIINSDKKLGIVGPKQQLYKDFFDFSAGYSPNLFFEFLGLLGINIFFEGFVINLIKKFSKNKVLKVNWILGACIFIKSEIFKKVNGFDKDFFMFFEEVDLCKRVKNLGYEIKYYSMYSIYHIGSVSGKKDYFNYTIRTYESKYLYISKSFGLFKRKVYNLLLKSEMVVQIIIWSILYFKNKSKSTHKIRAYFYLLKKEF